MQIIGQLITGAVADLRADGTDDTAAAIARITQECGMTVRPLHPGSTDPGLRRYFVVDVPPGASAEGLATRLRNVAGVDGAYVKVPGEPPADAP